MRIGELAKRLGVATSKLRFLEAHGLIRPARRLPSGYRDYDESVVETLQIILQAQSFGFTLEEISRSFVETRQHGLRCDYIIKLLNGKLQELDRHIEQTWALRARLADAVDEFEARRVHNQRPDVEVKRHGLLQAGLVSAKGGKTARQTAAMAEQGLLRKPLKRARRSA